MIDYSSHRYSSMPQGEFESYTRRSWLRRVVRLGPECSLVGFGIAASLCFPAAAQSRQIGIDIPVQWVTDIDGSMTPETFSPCRRVRSLRGSASPHLATSCKNVLV
jgi:hypothetical protein